MIYKEIKRSFGVFKKLNLIGVGYIVIFGYKEAIIHSLQILVIINLN